MPESCYIEQRDEERFVHSLTHGISFARAEYKCLAILLCFALHCSGYDCRCCCCCCRCRCRFFSLFFIRLFVGWFLLVACTVVVVVAVAAAVFSFILFVHSFHSYIHLFSISRSFPLIHFIRYYHLHTVFMCPLVLYVRYVCACACAYAPAHSFVWHMNECSKRISVLFYKVRSFCCCCWWCFCCCCCDIRVLSSL